MESGGRIVTLVNWMRSDRAVALCAIVLCAIAADAHAVEFDLSAAFRVRFEDLNGQFRPVPSDTEHIVTSRSVIKLDAALSDRFALIVEGYDARAFLADEDTPLSTSLVNTTDILQSYLAFQTPSFEAKLGRFTVDIGSRRLVERSNFSNGINAYTGLHVTRKTAKMTVDAFRAMRVERRPSDGVSLLDHDTAFDQEVVDRFWGVHAQRHGKSHQFELFVYGFVERDTPERMTGNERYLEPGMRIYRRPVPGQYDFEVEAAFRHGTTEVPHLADRTEQDLFSYFAHAEIGYTFQRDWQPRIAFKIDVASGDDDPLDDRYERYDRKFGARSDDFGATSIFGALTRTNILSPGLEFSFRRDPFKGRIMLQNPRLHSRYDVWAAGQRIDVTGQSGSEIGWALDARIDYGNPGTHRWDLRLGASYLWYGEFVENVTDGALDQSSFGYAQFVYKIGGR